ncbi:transglutaminase domain-containing protein [Paenibacillus sp. NEAU-GSW1]|uniref:transglutaminase domain-containing protein n=1 Tax=Paenibacillus sp. NEAU-GSW1 TaxID=2682486 RepID=UPI0012E1279F|nr:transglutaminase-like domain-containing protein [Paenibacillus sp. NEAU-GSW1]MUT68515.1 transglutaminase domain-containing protein [Paenibacillus sp. NEAU-GSW1]
MTDWVRSAAWWEPVTLIVLALLLISLLQGMRRGASGSAKRLFFFVWDGIWIVVSLFFAARIAESLSPVIAKWLAGRIVVPKQELDTFAQLWYTWVTSVKDFALLRFGVLFLLSYGLLRLAVSYLLTPLIWRLPSLRLGNGEAAGARGKGRHAAEPATGDRAASRAAGALIGAIHGSGRAFVFIAALFIYVSMVPNGIMVETIKQSPVYREAAAVLEPVAGDVIASQGPVLAEAAQAEFQNILQRKYEIIDYAIPADIESAALQVTKDADDDEAKARALYAWLGTRIAYDWDKARNYEERGVWKEQTPQDTFDTRTGVCIDVARLYAVMARAAGLEVRVVTGLGADGRGGYGPHAWNEVRIGGEQGSWIPLDATWASSGDWFNPPGFEQTHIRET